MAVETRTRPGLWTRLQTCAVTTVVVAGVVCRWWALGDAGLSFDESFTASYSALPIGEIPAALRGNDSHPPLDYLLRHFVAGSGSELLLRAPSAVCSTLALLVVAVWMRRRSWFGVGVVALVAFSPFQLLVGRQARMYAAMTLLGALVAFLSERWLDGDRRARVPATVGALLVVACFSHVGGVLFAGGTLLVAGLARDRESWIWRAAPTVAVVVWAVVWGPSFLDQMRLGASSWIPTTNLVSLDDTVNGMVTMFEGTRWIGTALVLGGGVALWRKDAVLGRVWVALFLVPFAVLGLLGLRYHVLLPRTLAASSWAAPVGLAAVVEWAWQRWKAVGIGLAAIVAVVTLRSLPAALSYDENNRVPMGAIDEAVAPGDGLVIHPHWLWPLAWWELQAGRGEPVPPQLAGIDAWYWQRPGAAPSGRTWIAEPSSYHLDVSRWPTCGEQRDIGSDWELACVVTGVPSP